MSREQQLELARGVYREVITARAAYDDWLLVHFDWRTGGNSIGADSRFTGVEGGREWRGPRWRALDDAWDLAPQGYQWVAAGPRSLAVLVRTKLDRQPIAGAILHITVVKRWFPDLAIPRPTFNSVDGFICDTGTGRSKTLGARRPGRCTRARLKRPCAFCAATKNLTLHHLVRREWGGATEEPNLVTVCRPCHEKIHAGELDDSSLLQQVWVERTRRILEQSRTYNEAPILPIHSAGRAIMQVVLGASSSAA